MKNNLTVNFFQDLLTFQDKIREKTQSFDVAMTSFPSDLKMTSHLNIMAVNIDMLCFLTKNADLEDEFLL